MRINALKLQFSLLKVPELDSPQNFKKTDMLLDLIPLTVQNLCIKTLFCKKVVQNQLDMI